MKQILKSASNYKGMIIQQMLVVDDANERHMEWRICPLETKSRDYFVAAISLKEAESIIDSGEIIRLLPNTSDQT
jgi:hypothetical protein